MMVPKGEVGRGMGETGDGDKEGTCCDEHQVLYGSVEMSNHHIVHLKLILHYVNWNLTKNL